MENLLKFAIEAHGRLDRWQKFSQVKANVSISGGHFGTSSASQMC